MAQTTSFVGESFDRIQNAYENAQTEIEKFQTDLQDRRKKFEKRAEKEFKRIRKEVQQSSPVKRAVALQEDVNAQIGAGFDAVLGNLQIASRSDFQKLDKKLNKINRKLSALDKAIGKPETAANGVAAD